jgi:PilZ domain-containing protein
MTWDECRSKLTALVTEAARSSPHTSAERVEEFLRMEREIGLVEELAAFICEYFGLEVDERPGPRRRLVSEGHPLCGRAHLPQAGQHTRMASGLDRGWRQLFNPLRRLTGPTRRIRKWSASRDAAPTRGGSRMRLEGMGESMERRRATRAMREWPVEVGSRPQRVWSGRTVNVSVSGMRVRFDKPLELRWRSVLFLDPGNSLGPIAIRYALVREITPSREYAIRFLDLHPQSVDRLEQLLA